MGEIYKITNKINGKSYIGATTEDFDGRYHGGRWWASTHNHHLQDDAYRFGEAAFAVEILERDIPAEDLAEAEFDMITVHDTYEPRGYNRRKQKQTFKPKEDPEEKRVRLDKLRRNRIRRELYTQISQCPKRLEEVVKTVREMLGKTQEEFAEFQGVALRTLREVEQGIANPTFETVKKLLRGTGLTVGITRKDLL